MKVIAIFAGKGGVGKSSVAALLALALRDKYKVAILDADLNTPSVPVLFKRAKGLKNIKIFSAGNTAKSGKAIALTGGAAKTTLRGLVRQVRAYQPDVCVIDLPPGTGDVLMQISEKFKPSSFLLVLQPNELAREDALRAIDLFFSTGIPIAGIIENMVGEVFGEGSSVNIMDLPILASIPLRTDIARAGSDGRIHEVKNNPLEVVAKKVLEKISEVSWKQVPRKLLEGPSLDEYMNNYDVFKRENLKFVGTQTWDHIRHRLGEEHPFSDDFLVYNDANTVRKMLDGLDEDNMGMFMILRPPCTEVKLFPGEIGMAHLWVGNTFHYGVPSVAYQTDQGEIRLFPHEVSPASPEFLMELQDAKELLRAKNSTNPRYLPNEEILMQINCAFGPRVSACKDWKKEYKRLGV